MITYFRGLQSTDSRQIASARDVAQLNTAATSYPPNAIIGRARKRESDPNSPILLEHEDVLAAIVEPRGFLRECMVRYLAAFCGASVGGCETLEDVLAENADRPCDLIILSTANRPRHAALSDVTRLRENGVSCPVMILVEYCDHSFIHDALRHGVRGIVPMTISADIAVEAIRLVLAGGTFVPAEALLTQPRSVQQASPNNHNHLTAREQQILALLRQGKQNKQIAYELALSEGTVKVHIHNIMRKFGVNNRTQILAATA